MNEKPHVVIVTGRCEQSHALFGIRFEEHTHNRWLGTWAFALKEATAKREGYERNRVNGRFGFDNDYPGCPHCLRKSIVLCSCGHVVCWDGESPTITCPWCNQRGEIRGEVETLDAGMDR